MTLPYTGDKRPELSVTKGEKFKLLVRIHFIIEMILWTGLASWEFDLTFTQVTLPYTGDKRPELSVTKGEKFKLLHVNDDGYCLVTFFFVTLKPRVE